MPVAAHRSLTKVRHTLRHAGHTMELYRYQGRLAPLAIAEVEFADADAAASFQPPACFGGEVTDDVRYRNSSLAMGQVAANGSGSPLLRNCWTRCSAGTTAQRSWRRN
jgi:CYTH domain-containing protein